MNHVNFVYNGIINGYPSWVGYDGTTQLVIYWTGLYWVMSGWPYDGEPRNYNNTLNPTDGWALYNNTTLTATFSVVLGACPIPTPSPTATPSKTPTPSPTPNRSPTPTPSITPSPACDAPVLNNVTFIGRTATSYNFGLFFTPTSTCSDMIYEYSCDFINWTSCNYTTCGAGFGCNSPVQVTIDSLNSCTTCNGTWYFRIKQCCSGLQSGYSNPYAIVPISSSPSPTPTATITPSRTPSRTPSISVTPSITVSPSITPTPTPSSSPGTCRFITALNTVVRVNTNATIQYTKCDGTLSTFNVFLPAGTNEVNISSLNICALYNTPVIAIIGTVTSLEPIYGGPCSSPPPTPPKLCKLIKALNTRLKTDPISATVQYTKCDGTLSTFIINLTYGNNNVDVSSLNICAQVDTPVTILAPSGVITAVFYAGTCTSTPARTTLVNLPFGFNAGAACSGDNTNSWCLNTFDLCTATQLYLSDGIVCLSPVTDALWLANGENVRYWNGTSFSDCSLCP